LVIGLAMASPKIGTPESKARHDGTAGRHLQSGVRSEEEPWHRERTAKRETIQILCGQFVHRVREKVVHNYEAQSNCMVGLPLSESVAFNGRVPASQTLLLPDPRPLVERLGAEFFRQLPERPGVYLMRDAVEVVLYVGKAKSLRHRLNNYRVANPDRMGRRHLRLLRQVVRIELLECADEAAALAKEAELLRTLKPKFNRAGVWSGPPRFLVWRANAETMQFAITLSPKPGWQEFGPWGSGVVYLRAALIRLLWYALNPSLGSIDMPAGRWQGRLAAITTLSDVSEEAQSVLAKLLAGNTDDFVQWIGARTQSLPYAHDRDTRDADLETVVTLIQAKLRRTASFETPDQGITAKSRSNDSDWLFPEQDLNEP
jgi:hypothetical protein